MFGRWGNLVYRLRYTVLGVMVAGLLGLGAYGLGLADHLSQGGYFDNGSESVAASKLSDSTYAEGRDTTGDVVAIYTARAGETVDDPQFSSTITDNLNNLQKNHPDQILAINASYFKTDTGLQSTVGLVDKAKQHAIASIAIVGANDTELATNFRDVRDAFYIDGIDVQLAGLQPVAGAINDTLQNDIHRMELLAIPAVAVLLFFIFGGIVAAALPLICGGLTVVAANGIVALIANFTEVNAFVAPVVSLVGLGLAIDYGLFIVSRFREELAEGHDTAPALRRTVMTAGRTVVFSATMIVASLGGLLLFPQAFLKSVAYGSIATVSLAGVTAVTVLPAILGMLGHRVDAWGLKWFRKTKTADEVESGFWGRLARWSMKHPLKIAIPIVIGLLLLIIPVNGLKLGGLSDQLLPPDNATRLADEELLSLFPTYNTQPLKLVVTTSQSTQIGPILQEANSAPGLAGAFGTPGAPKDDIWVMSANLADVNNPGPTIDYLRAMTPPDGAQILVGGTPALTHDTIATLADRLPWMIVLVVLVTSLLMFLTFGSVVLPIKAALMSALGLGSTLGILTWIFVDGHGAGVLNFTPGPILSPVLVVIIALIYGLSTDYEVFLLSRMVEARALGASTTEAVRVGTAHTGRIITAAALILIVVTGAFGFSDLVIMQYIAYGMIAALIIDATLIRMFLVPATMKLLGDDCWWAPAWMKRIQERLGLGEPILHQERMPHDVPDLQAVGGVRAPAGQADSLRAKRAADPLTEPLARIGAINSRVKPPRSPKDEELRRSVTGAPAVAPSTDDDGDRSPATRVPATPQGRPIRPEPPSDPAPQPSDPAPQPDRPSGDIADWLADLGTTNQPSEPEVESDETGRHRRSADHQAVSVNELLERENRR